MADFAFLYRGRNIPASPEQRQRHYDKWFAWFKDMTAKGYIKNPGHPLDDPGKVISGSKKAVHDGPFAEAKDVVAGFTVIEANDLDAATAIAADCPILEVGGSVEIRPVRQMAS
jgi:hypothetical protein